MKKKPDNPTSLKTPLMIMSKVQDRLAEIERGPTRLGHKKLAKALAEKAKAVERQD